MPTPKQVRYHYGKLNKLMDKLQEALVAAHTAEVIVYSQEFYKEQGPCFSFWEMNSRVDKTTEKQLAEAMRKEIKEQK